MKDTRNFDRAPLKDIRVKDNLIGVRTPQVLMSRESGDYLKGDILDANATMLAIKQASSGSGSDDIDLSNYVTYDYIRRGGISFHMYGGLSSLDFYSGANYTGTGIEIHGGGFSINGVELDGDKMLYLFDRTFNLDIGLGLGITKLGDKYADEAAIVCDKIIFHNYDNSKTACYEIGGIDIEGEYGHFAISDTSLFFSNKNDVEVFRISASDAPLVSIGNLKIKEEKIEFSNKGKSTVSYMFKDGFAICENNEVVLDKSIIDTMQNKIADLEKRLEALEAKA